MYSAVPAAVAVVIKRRRHRRRRRLLNQHTNLDAPPVCRALQGMDTEQTGIINGLIAAVRNSMPTVSQLLVHKSKHACCVLRLQTGEEGHECIEWYTAALEVAVRTWFATLTP